MQSQRYYSLDVFRGATVALMILVNNPGSWDHIYAPLEHAAWHGLTPTDLVFPFFLIAVGNAMAFVLPRLVEAGPAIFWKKIIRRTLLIFFIGLLLNWFPFITYDASGQLAGKPFSDLRIMGVLQRIALCYFFAAGIIYFLKARGAFVFSAFILLAYWWLSVFLNPADPFSLQGWFGTDVDKFILGSRHMYHGEGIAFDPEGFMSLPAAIAQVIFGYLAGSYILAKGKTPEMLNGLFVIGCVLLLTGFIWDMSFPINKKIWTSSYTVYTTGMGLMVMGVLTYVTEFKNKRGWWSRFFDVFGKNALFIFVLSGLIPRMLNLVRIPLHNPTAGSPGYVTPLRGFFRFVLEPMFTDPRLASFIYAACFITMMWLLAWVLDRKKIYIRV